MKRAMNRVGFGALAVITLAAVLVSYSVYTGVNRLERMMLPAKRPIDD